MCNWSVEEVIQRIKPKVSRLAYRYQNAQYDMDDLASEINLRVIAVLTKGKDKYSDKTIDDMVNISVVIADRFSKTFAWYCARRPDTSLYCTHMEDENTLFELVSEEDSLEDVASCNDMINKVLLRLRESKKDKDLLNFFELCVHPTVELIDYFECRKKEQFCKYKSMSFIPPSVVCEFLGFSGTKLCRLQRRMFKVFSKIGYTAIDIFGFKTLKERSEAWYRFYGLDKEEMLKSGC